MITAMQQEAVVSMINVLLDAGFQLQDSSDINAVRLIAAADPLYGKGSGILTTFHGAVKFVKPNSTLRVTVGSKTTAIYRQQDEYHKARGVLSIETRDHSLLRHWLKNHN